MQGLRIYVVLFGKEGGRKKKGASRNGNEIKKERERERGRRRGEGSWKWSEYLFKRG